MNNVVVGFSTPKNFNLFSWLIRTLGGSTFSHAYLRYHDDVTGEDIVFQASGRLVNMIDYARFCEVEKICAEFKIPVEDKKKIEIISWCEKKLGIPYAVASIIGFGPVLIARLFKKKIKNPFGDGESKLFCSEAVCYVLEDLQISPDELDPETAMPIDLFNFLAPRGYERLV